jgi:hypothetical protein
VVSEIRNIVYAKAVDIHRPWHWYDISFRLNVIALAGVNRQIRSKYRPMALLLHPNHCRVLPARFLIPFLQAYFGSKTDAKEQIEVVLAWNQARSQELDLAWLQNFLVLSPGVQIRVFRDGGARKESEQFRRCLARFLVKSRGYIEDAMAWNGKKS